MIKLGHLNIDDDDEDLGNDDDVADEASKMEEVGK